MKKNLLLMFMMIVTLSSVSAKEIIGVIEAGTQPSEITGFKVVDNNDILTKAEIVYGGKYDAEKWHLIFYVKQGATAEHIKALAPSFEPSDLKVQYAPDPFSMGFDLYVVGATQLYTYSEFVASKSIDGTIKSEYKDAQGKVVTPEITAFKVTDSDEILTEAVLEYNNEQGGVWNIIYYIKQGATQEQVAALTPSFEPSTLGVVHAGDIMQNGGDLWMVGEMQIWIQKENVSATPIAKITETLNYAFDRNADWVHNYEKNYADPLDWASSNAGAVGASMVNPNIPFPVSKVVEGENTYLELKTVKSGLSEPNVLVPNVLSGSTFFGRFELNMFASLKSTKFGLPLEGGYVTEVSGKFKYESGETFYNNYEAATPNKKDQWSVVAVIYEVANLDEALDGTNIATITDKTIAMGAFVGNEATDWTAFNCPLFLIDAARTMDPAKLYKAAVIFSSSVDGAAYNGAIGSKLSLDDLIISVGATAPGLPPVAIENTNTTTIRIYSADSAIRIEGNDAQEPVQVYSAQGTLIYNGTDSSISNVEKNALYIVKVGQKVTKVLVK